MSKFFYIIIFLTVLAIPFFSVRAVPQTVKEDVIGGLNNTMGEAGLEEQKMGAEGATADAMSGKVSGTIGSIMRIAVLAFVGVIFLNTVIYAGFLWMTSGGNEEKLAKAKNMITAAAIGMLLILGAYIITDFVLQKMVHTVGIYENMPEPQGQSPQLFNPLLQLPPLQLQPEQNPMPLPSTAPAPYSSPPYIDTPPPVEFVPPAVPDAFRTDPLMEGLPEENVPGEESA